MKVVLFLDEGCLRLPIDAAIDMMLWLPQRYDYNHSLYECLKSSIAKSLDGIVILEGNCFYDKKFRTNPSFVDSITKWKVPYYEVLEIESDYYDIKNIGKGNESVLIPDLDGYVKGYNQEIDTYLW